VDPSNCTKIVAQNSTLLLHCLKLQSWPLDFLVRRRLSLAKLAENMRKSYNHYVRHSYDNHNDSYDSTSYHGSSDALAPSSSQLSCQTEDLLEDRGFKSEDRTNLHHHGAHSSHSASYEIHRRLSPSRGTQGTQELLQDRQSRSVTPEPPPAPTPSYLSLAQIPSTHLGDPATSPKLLILDLNGTLVHRSPHGVRAKMNGPISRDLAGKPLPRLRPVHPRPYMSAFRSYLFAPETKRWLDVMVWSSAQPHSVADMVDRCFLEKKEELIAVWARDTLGLSENHYNRKVQTVKDLAKPWSLLPSLLTPLPPSPHPSQASTPRSDRSPSPEIESVPNTLAATPRVHSVLTTLLLDDSPKKAAMQPYNHICIGEYTAERRAKDLESLQKEQEWELAQTAREGLRDNNTSRRDDDVSAKALTRLRDASQHRKHHVSIQEQGEALASSSSVKRRRRKANPTAEEHGAKEKSISPSSGESYSSLSSSTHNTTKKPKRKIRRQMKLESLAKASRELKPDVVFDETLLSVIGVLDEIKQQSNVAAWIRAGGLWGPRASQGVHSPVDRPSDEGAAAAGVVIEEIQVSEPVDAAENNKRKKRKRRHRAAGPVDAKPTGWSLEAKSGNDALSEAQLGPRLKGSSADAPSKEQSASSVTTNRMWFEHEETMAFWAARGRNALEQLGIAVEHGILR